VDWYPLKARPDFCVGIDDRQPSDGEAIPVEVRERFAGSLRSAHTVVWNDPRTATVGVISDHGELAWKHDASQALVLSFQRPAKGSGWITLELRSGCDHERMIAFASKFREPYWDWMRELATAIATASHLELQLEDTGYDC
jgi:hypothetical protein